MSLIPSAAAGAGRRSLPHTLVLPEDERAVPLARHRLCHLMRVAGFAADRVDDAALMVSELAANAVTHAKSPYELRVARVRDLIECQVIDCSPSRLVLPRDSAGEGPGVGVASLAEHGRGLLIVSALSRGRCGCRPVRLESTATAGKAVYFALPWPEGI